MDATEPPFVWVCVANVTRRPHTEGTDEIRLGTKRFSPGTKVFILPPWWGDGMQHVTVLGRHRNSSRLVEITMDAKYLENARVSKVFQPYVAGYQRWDKTEESRVNCEQMAKIINGRVTCHEAGMSWNEVFKSEANRG
jgi:hypothetical protein